MKKTNWIYDLDFTLYNIENDLNINNFNYNKLHFNNQLNNNIKLLKGKKILYTNGTLLHTLACIRQMKLEKIFNKICCRELTGLKPDVNSYMKLFNFSNVEFEDNTYFFEDTIENLLVAKNLGWTTILICPDEKKSLYVKNNMPKIDYVFNNIIDATNYFIEKQ